MTDQAAPGVTPTTPAVPTNPTQGNEQGARTPEGTLKDPASQPAPTEAKPAEGAKPTEAKPAEAKGPPEKYEFKAPEGRELDAKAIEAATPIFKELGLTNDQAQKLVAFQAERDAATQTAGEKLVETMRAEWRDRIAKDPVLGDGKDNLKSEVRANLDKVKAALPTAERDAFVQALDLTGSGDNPAVIAALNSIGKLLSEGSAVRGGGPSTAGQSAPGTTEKPSAARALFPNLKSSSQA